MTVFNDPNSRISADSSAQRNMMEEATLALSKATPEP